MNVAEPNPVMSPARRRLILLAMTGSLSMIMIDITMVGVALPEIGRDLQLDGNALEWVVNAYLLVMASLIALGGRVGDYFGKPRVFVVGMIIFALGSLWCGLSGSGISLIAGRVCQGFGAVLMQPASSAIVLSSAPPEARGRTMAVYVGIPLLFLTMGPLMGGLITEWFGWSWAFLVNIPIAVIALVITFKARPQDTGSVREPLDLPGTFFLVLGMPCFVIALQQSGVWGPLDPRTIGLGIVGVIALVLFGRRQFVAEHPVLHFGLFRDKAFMANALLLMLVQFSLAGVLIQLSLYAQIVLEYDPAEAGLAILPLMIPVLLVVHFAGRSYDRMGVRIPAAIGVVGSVIGLALMGWGAWVMSYPIIVVGMIFLGGTTSFATMPANTDGMARVPPMRRGQASGILQTCRQVGGALGIATYSAAGALTRPPGDSVVRDCGADPGVVDLAIAGDVDAIGKLEASGATECVAMVHEAISRGTGSALFVGALVTMGGLFIALRFAPSAPFGKNESTSQPARTS